MGEGNLVGPLGTGVSYSQAGYNLLGRIIEKVTGVASETAVAQLLFEPLGLSHSFFARDDVMTRRFAVGPNACSDPTLSIAPPLGDASPHNPGGGLSPSL